jgi:hypothetical protein
MNDNIDNTLHKYFQNFKSEIPDNGFSDKVMAEIPDESGYKWILYVAYAFGLLLFIFTGSYKLLIGQVYLFLINSGTLHLPSLVSLVAFLSIGLFIWLFARISFDENLI